MEKLEGDAAIRAKLEAFRKKLMTGRLVKFWTDANGLAAAVATSLPWQMKVHPRTGWVRADSVAQEEVLKDNLRFREENERLEAENTRLKKVESVTDLLSKSAELGVRSRLDNKVSRKRVSIEDVLRGVGLVLQAAASPYGLRLEDSTEFQDYFELRDFLVTYDIIEVSLETYGKRNRPDEVWVLSERGLACYREVRRSYYEAQESREEPGQGDLVEDRG